LNRTSRSDHHCPAVVGRQGERNHWRFAVHDQVAVFLAAGGFRIAVYPLKVARNQKRELEERLIGRLQQFILELGYGFCFVGRQYRLALGAKEYFVDLLFYHRFLKALVAFDLKVVAFEPEFAGKMDFYLNLLNEKERAPDDRPSIGIILCAEKDDVEVEFALKSKGNPIGVAEYRMQSKLPAEFKGKLPTAKQLADVVREILPGAARPRG